jgi:hypothetical protein
MRAATSATVPERRLQRIEQVVAAAHAGQLDKPRQGEGELLEEHRGGPAGVGRGVGLHVPGKHLQDAGQEEGHPPAPSAGDRVASQKAIADEIDAEKRAAKKAEKAAASSQSAGE